MCTVDISYVYLNTQTCMYIFKKNMAFCGPGFVCLTCPIWFSVASVLVSALQCWIFPESLSESEPAAPHLKHTHTYSQADEERLTLTGVKQICFIMRNEFM